LSLAAATPSSTTLTPRFWFGPVCSHPLDALLLPRLIRQGGWPFRVQGQQVCLGTDPPVFARWQALAAWQPQVPVLGLLPFERQLPLALWQQTLVLGLLVRELAHYASQLPVWAELSACWLPETPADRAMLAAAGQSELNPWDWGPVAAAPWELLAPETWPRSLVPATLLQAERRYWQLPPSVQSSAQPALQQPLPVVSLAAESGLYWEGAFGQTHSLAHVNTSLLQVLPDLPWQLWPTEPLPPAWQPDWQHLPESDMAAALPASAQPLLLAHHYPPRLQAPPQGRWVNIMPWEYGSLPRAWQPLRGQIDEVWVPAEAVRQGFLCAGFRPAQVQVIPNGVQTRLFCPEGPVFALPTSRRFRFLFVGGLIYRKGIDLLLQAWTQAFGPAEEVCLVLKETGAQGSYALEQYRLLAQDLAASSDCAEILYLDAELSPEELAALYRSCQVYVHPYRGEGFGLPILEAMACGLPVVVPDLGPAPEFVPDAAAYWVRSRWVFDQQAAQDLQLLGPAWQVEPELAQLVTQLRRAWQDSASVRAAKGQAAHQQAQAYDWQQIGKQVRSRIQFLQMAAPAAALPQVLFAGPPELQAWLPEAPGWHWVPEASASAEWLESAYVLQVAQGQALRAGDLVWLLDWTGLPEPVPSGLFWLVADQALGQALQARGVAPESIGFLPLCPPQIPMPASVRHLHRQFTCLLAPGQPQLLAALEALLAALLLQPEGPSVYGLNLVVAEAQLEALLAELEPLLDKFSEAQLPELELHPQASLLLPAPALLQASDCLLFWWFQAPLSWCLAAQQAQIPVSACAQYQLAAPPWCDVLDLAQPLGSQPAWGRLLAPPLQPPQTSAQIAALLAPRCQRAQAQGAWPEALQAVKPC